MIGSPMQMIAENCGTSVHLIETHYGKVVVSDRQQMVDLGPIYLLYNCCIDWSPRLDAEVPPAGRFVSIPLTQCPDEL